MIYDSLISDFFRRLSTKTGNDLYIYNWSDVRPDV